MRRVPLLLLLLLLTLSVHASAVADSPQNDKVAPTDPVVHIKLGESTVELAGPWKFHVGDDTAWAQPDFNDSSWEEVDLTPDGKTGLSSGWTARGHKGYSGFAWYRLQVNVEGAKHSLGLKMPYYFDDAYQLFVNGQRIGEFGKFTDHHVTAYAAIPIDFRMPKDVRDGKVTIAIRTWMDSATPFNSADAGGLRAPPELGYASAVSDQLRLDWDDAGHYFGSAFLEMLILLMALLMALALFWLDRNEKSYLWLALVCEASLLIVGLDLLVNFTTWIGLTAYIILRDIIATPVRIGLWVMFWGYWFRLERIRALHVAVWSLVAILSIGTALLRPPLYGEHVPIQVGTYLHPFLLIVKLGLGVLLLLVLYRGFRKSRKEGAIAAPAVILAVIAIYSHELLLIHVQTTFTILSFTISLGSISTMLSLLIITVMLLGRFITAQRAKEQWKLEIAQARHIQQVLIPNILPQINDLHIDSEYRPAREVGGDFFQIVPKDEDGTSLIVFGDVTGKGLQAGMLVAMIVGAIRSTAQHDNSPERILEALNEQLCERESASATCMVLRFSPNGVVELANAGQLPPYLNGKELQIEGALPLGMLSGMDFPVTSFELEPGDSLMIMSDGVVEAQNAYGELFGFERIEEMLRNQTTTADIATAAQKFGQTDDILVLRVERCAPRTVLHTQPQEAYT
ncbi:MAG TPA: SpoIIE family protein phosphatase [Candidatus Sulfotelmatobacter sp.]